ncbi:MAG: four helix bundle protein [Candidatus Vogelbacteria bacterium CG10_big_fil_rev_8_21_14_0_10_51_16]|uniref:Four helix bundle protein n=1 Tax=Candidatus Vogelbacteria bacterium CG10_big_fil_rev_8_21_14_0_10_51_16 TaxID=1975045 RepID=A0A2H0RDU5_9BACT|nr:MAG: four helix bundle protein [Candidatus Vogelbacteria bacterium CG10_big_fil_rev_8_21_14_0_10_51_16]
MPNLQQLRSSLHFRNLLCWQEAHALALMVYKTTENFPRQEQFGLASQLRRAATSVTSNIAEGYGRQSVADKLHFYTMARGSLLEIQSQVVLARDLGYLKISEEEEFLSRSILAHKLINGLIAKMRTKQC